eukprot:CAMPEP_0182424400 /NCGR_PEP_ID=MMETSP1167-20130531/10624_1 /TAXON_ID=2988 /ORGANISM="Mallomonas Sp, Strain CCMP3275" /LENGTH=76 /DNA_ID=CAMNT_0024604207 /DNA_START=267 /DNA_END=494 /DNA_ORIENTATION=-
MAQNIEQVKGQIDELFANVESLNKQVDSLKLSLDEKTREVERIKSSYEEKASSQYRKMEQTITTAEDEAKARSGAW